MPPRELSRHSFTTVAIDDQGRQWLTRREPYGFRQFADTAMVEVGKGDSLYTIAGQRYRSIDPERACGLWWLIADFQPDPIHDPTISLQVGRRLHIPSVRVVREEIFAETRRE